MRENIFHKDTIVQYFTYYLYKSTWMKALSTKYHRRVAIYSGGHVITILCCYIGQVIAFVCCYVGHVITFLCCYIGQNTNL